MMAEEMRVYQEREPTATRTAGGCTAGSEMRVSDASGARDDHDAIR
jgi:hypothetical protein